MLSLVSTQVNAQQTISKKEAQKIATDINKAVDKLDESLAQIDWNALGNILTQTIEAIDKNADALTEIAKNIDIKKINAQIEKVAAKMENSIDMEHLEKQLNTLGEQLEKKEKEIKNDK